MSILGKVKFRRQHTCKTIHLEQIYTTRVTYEGYTQAKIHKWVCKHQKKKKLLIFAGVVDKEGKQRERRLKNRFKFHAVTKNLHIWKIWGFFFFFAQ